MPRLLAPAPGRTVLLLSTDAALALVLLLGAPSRTSSPTFAAIRQTIGIRPWGALLLACVALTVAGLFARPAMRPDHGGLAFAVPISLAAGWWTYCAIAFGVSAALDPRAALTGSVVYACIAVAHVLLAFRAED